MARRAAAWSATEDTTGLEGLLARTARAVRGALARLPAGGGIDADEIEQEVRLRLWKAVESGREIRNPASYVYRVAVTATIDALRRRRARREEPLGVSDPAADGEAETVERLHRRELVRRAELALEDLATDRRRALALHLRGFSNREVGELLGWSEPRARNLIYRGLADLRSRLRDSGVECEGG